MELADNGNQMVVQRGFIYYTGVTDTLINKDKEYVAW